MPTLPRPFCRALLAFGVAAALAPAAAAQPLQPAPPAKYDVLARYRLRIGIDERVAQFFDMTKRLDGIGFERVPGDENEPADPLAERLRGKLPAAKVGELLADSRIRSALLVPDGYALPDDPAARVLVSLTLDTGFAGPRQRDLFLQTLEQLRSLGFAEKVGYDHRGFSRALGTLPVGDLTALVADLRGEPGGWTLPDRPVDTLPEPLRSISPVRLAEVLNDKDAPALADAPPPADAGPLAKVSPDLRPLVGAEGEAVRVEVVLAEDPPLADATWRDRFPVPGVTVEGRAGRVVTARATPVQVRDLAASPAVLAVRKPRAAERPAPAPGGEAVLDLSKPAARIAGRGLRIAVVDSDFAGLATLGKGVTLLDLTGERSPDLRPDPLPGDAPGRGTLVALAIKSLTPAAEVTLVRIDPTAPYQLLTVARFAAGDARRTVALRDRRAELVSEGQRLARESGELNRDRLQLNENFSQDPDDVAKRTDLAKRQADYSARLRAYELRGQRLDALESGLLDLRRVSTVANLLTWQDGLPTNGQSALTRYLDEYVGDLSARNPKREPVRWLQAVGDTRGQTWTGGFADRDNNGVLEFGPAPAGQPGRWTPELNFLRQRSPAGEVAAELPAGSKLRLTLQWTEPHDLTVPPELYRTPLADLRLVLVQQRDPEGKTVASDDLAVVARSDAQPQIVARSPQAATYEQVVEYAVERAGRYAVRVEGKTPAGIRPAGLPTLPFLQPQWSLLPRLAVESSGTPGRAVLGDYAPDLAGPGAPADSRVAVTIGAADATGTIAADTARGAQIGQELTPKPTRLAPGDLLLPGGHRLTGSAAAVAVAATE